MEINLIIRELLAKHNYISLPGLGSFIQKYEPARPSSVVDGFLAPKQSISFDTTRTFNDEAIDNYLCDKLGIPLSKANEMLTDFVRRLQEELDNGKECNFENVGILSKNKKGKIRFEQAKELEAAFSTYGLKDVDVKKLSVKAKKQKQAASITTQPVSSIPEQNPKRKSTANIFAGIVVVIAIVALTASFILIPDLRFWEKFTGTDKTIAESKKDLSAGKTENQIQASNTVSSLPKKDSLSTKIDQSISDKTVKKTALYYEEPKQQEKKTFYIIFGSFGKLENAQKQLDKFKQKGYKTEIIKGNSMFRVSINKFTDKSIAIEEFNKFRNEYPNESVWVLGI